MLDQCVELEYDYSWKCIIIVDTWLELRKKSCGKVDNTRGLQIEPACLFALLSWKAGMYNKKYLYWNNKHFRISVLTCDLPIHEISAHFTIKFGCNNLVSDSYHILSYLEQSANWLDRFFDLKYITFCLLISLRTKFTDTLYISLSNKTATHKH